MRPQRLRELERQEWRVLGALEPVDATSRMPVLAPLRVSATGARILRNRSGLYVIARWSPLAAHEASFDAPPPLPAPGAERLDVTLDDPAGRYLPRVARVALPRNPDPAAADSLFVAVAVPLFTAPAAALGTNWCALRVHVTASDNGDALGGALLRVVAGDQVLARGLSDWRGEALVPVAGVPVSTWSAGADQVVVTSIDATLEAVFDPAAGTRVSAAEVRAGREPAAGPVADPDDLEARRATLPDNSAAVSLAARGALNVNLGLVLP